MIEELEQLISDGRSVYFACGYNGVVRSDPAFCTIWAKPSDRVLAQGTGRTVSEAIRAALGKLDSAPVPLPPGF